MTRIDPELGFEKINFLCRLRIRKKNGTLPKHIVELAETIPNFYWSDIKWVSKTQFIQWCKDNGIKNLSHFRKTKRHERPANIPSRPHIIYPDFSWGDISGKYYSMKWISREKFIKWCKDNGIKKRDDFEIWCNKNKKPKGIPRHTELIKNFKWGDVSGNYRNKEYCSKKEFIQWCKDNGIKNGNQFRKWKKENIIPKNITTQPCKIYKNDFLWGDVSGRYVNVKWCTKEEFIQFCQNNNIKSRTEHRKWIKINKKPKNIPYSTWKIFPNWKWEDIKND